ncbi:MAG: ABC transporter ATP-binding protein [Bacillota bacterium]
MAVVMKEVSWIREDNIILNQINWEVRSGEHWAIIGLNGSGKTSLLNLITGYIFPSKGEITVLGHRFGSYDLRELRKSIGWVSSSLQEKLHGNDNVEEIVLSGKYATIGIYEKPAEDDIKQARLLLEQFECASFAKRKYFTLSQGEKQKVLLARALISAPELLILDEPCTGLDLFARESFLSKVAGLGMTNKGITLIYVSHHIEEILPIFRHTLLLRQGSVHSSGKSEKVLASANLTEFFQRPVEINWKDGRPQIVISS